MSKKGSASNIPADCMPMCRTCSFFKPDKEASLGECHRFPPTVLPEDNGGVSFSFALTASDEWCGEYIRRVN
jgi:hypothetical protein